MDWGIPNQCRAWQAETRGQISPAATDFIDDDARANRL
jgi:hypothetical protein